MKLGNKVRIGLGVAAVVGAAGAVGLKYFAPQPTQQVDDQAGASALADSPALKQGTFAGSDELHSVSGSVAVHQTDSGGLLRFSNYDATSGPDVFFYLSNGTEFDPASAPRLNVPGGVGDGQATLRGNFSVPLPAGVGDFSHVVVWCKRFGVKFGEASLH